MASFCYPNGLFGNVVGYDVLCLGRLSLDREHVPAQQLGLPVRLIIRVRSGSSLASDWATCSRMACACHLALQERGIRDVHCLIFEADLVTRTRVVQGECKKFCYTNIHLTSLNTQEKETLTDIPELSCRL